MKKACIIGLVLAGLGAVPALAEGVRIYPYASKQNYCPTGLKPITINGVICCGTPNQKQSYQQVMAHSAGKKTYRTRAEKSCPEWAKGCY